MFSLQKDTFQNAKCLPLTQDGDVSHLIWDFSVINWHGMRSKSLKLKIFISTRSQGMISLATKYFVS